MPVSFPHDMSDDKPSRELRGFAEPDRKYLMVYMGVAFPHIGRVCLQLNEKDCGWLEQKELQLQLDIGAESSSLQDRTPVGGKSLPLPRDPGEAGVDTFRNTSDHSPLPTPVSDSVSALHSPCTISALFLTLSVVLSRFSRVRLFVTP